MRKLEFKMNSYKTFKDKALTLTTVLLSKTKIVDIIEYCKYNEYKWDITKDGIPTIMKDGKMMFIQSTGNTLYLIDKENGHEYKENLTELLLFYNAFVHSRSMAIDEDKIEFDINNHVKKFQSFFRIQRFEPAI